MAVSTSSIRALLHQVAEGGFTGMHVNTVGLQRLPHLPVQLFPAYHHRFGLKRQRLRDQQIGIGIS